MSHLLNADHRLRKSISPQVPILGPPLPLLVPLNLPHKLGTQPPLPCPLRHLDHLDGLLNAQQLVSFGLERQKKSTIILYLADAFIQSNLSTNIGPVVKGSSVALLGLETRPSGVPN